MVTVISGANTHLSCTAEPPSVDLVSRQGEGAAITGTSRRRLTPPGVVDIVTEPVLLHRLATDILRTLAMLC